MLVIALKIDLRWKSDRFRNSMADYKLGIVLKESDLTIRDAMFGLTEKIIGVTWWGSNPPTFYSVTTTFAVHILQNFAKICIACTEMPDT